MDNPKHYLHPIWPAPPSVKALTTTRLINGHSVAPYDSFNLATHVEDDPTTVTQNRQELVKALTLPHAPIWPQQVHGIEAISLDKPHTPEPVADAVYTHQTNRVCAILTADCLPILLCDQQGGTVAAIHAGWRGLLAGVIDSTIARMRVPGQQLLAWLGPAIGPQAFEINEDIRGSYILRDKRNQDAFHKKDQRWYGDLYVLARNNLTQLGVGGIYGGDLCTFTDSKRFYSYRRDGALTGRMATIIWITDA